MYTTDFGIPDATVEILGKDCDKCLYIPNDGISSLVPGELCYARVHACNAMGSSDASDTATGIPKSIPGPVADYSLNVVSCSEIEVHFSPPATVSSSVASGPHDDIERHSFQFDIVSDFKHDTFSIVARKRASQAYTNVPPRTSTM
jgi:hypothetical protein